MYRGAVGPAVTPHPRAPRWACGHGTAARRPPYVTEGLAADGWRCPCARVGPRTAHFFFSGRVGCAHARRRHGATDYPGLTDRRGGRVLLGERHNRALEVRRLPMGLGLLVSWVLEVRSGSCVGVGWWGASASQRGLRLDEPAQRWCQYLPPILSSCSARRMRRIEASSRSSLWIWQRASASWLWRFRMMPG